MSVCQTARRSNQSTLKEINSEYSLEGLMLKLKLQYISHSMVAYIYIYIFIKYNIYIYISSIFIHSLDKTPMLRKIEGQKRRGQQRISPLDSMVDSMDMNLGQLSEILKDRGA